MWRTSSLKLGVEVEEIAEGGSGEVRSGPWDPMCRREKSMKRSRGSVNGAFEHDTGFSRDAESQRGVGHCIFKSLRDLAYWIEA